MPSYEPLVEGLPTRPAPFIDAFFASFADCFASELQGTRCWPPCSQGVDQADAFKGQAMVDTTGTDDSRISAMLSQ